MKRQRAEGRRLRALVLFILLGFFSSFILHPSSFSADWVGVDESVVEKYAKDHGREAKEPLINTDQGDLLLFLFLIGGVIGGFAAGYYWRTLTEDRTKISERRQQKEEKVNGSV